MKANEEWKLNCFWTSPFTIRHSRFVTVKGRKGYVFRKPRKISLYIDQVQAMERATRNQWVFRSYDIWWWSLTVFFSASWLVAVKYPDNYPFVVKKKIEKKLSTLWNGEFLRSSFARQFIATLPQKRANSRTLGAVVVAPTWYTAPTMPYQSSSLRSSTWTLKQDYHINYSLKRRGADFVVS